MEHLRGVYDMVHILMSAWGIQYENVQRTHVEAAYSNAGHRFPVLFT
jgi:hypothetical protein